LYIMIMAKSRLSIIKTGDSHFQRTG
jgi:hypothetical protein